MPDPVRDPRVCPHDILVVLGPDVNRCEGCGAIVTGDEIRQELRILMHRIIRSQAR